ncbi:Pol polyprotein [Elysia marginata]|uniref:Pol polyprotein n=1 Tax=Elysia marginata TaxID=1093978 RepID=A0AAV4GM28_9GAST|nr:Pol polyprotein [Elysia marginata]
MVNYYRFLHGIAATLAPLHAQASGKGQKIDWSKECQDAFETTKEMLEFTSDIPHIKGKFIVVADALSRINSVGKDDQHKECINFEKLARAQEASDEMASYHTATTGLVLKDIDIGPSTLLCDISMGKSRPVLPTSWTRSIFNKIHGLSHSGVKPTQKAIAQRFVWNGMKRDFRR